MEMYTDFGLIHSIIIYQPILDSWKSMLQVEGRVSDIYLYICMVAGCHFEKYFIFLHIFGPVHFYRIAKNYCHAHKPLKLPRSHFLKMLRVFFAILFVLPISIVIPKTLWWPRTSHRQNS